MRLAFATGIHGEFANNGSLPWGTPIKEDMNHFVKFCAGKTMVMGYKTWLSLPESVQQKYKCLVIFTRKDDTYYNFKGLKFFIENEEQFISFIDFLSQCEDGLDNSTEYCVIGGAELVKTCLKNLEHFDKALHTLVNPKEGSLPATQTVASVFVNKMDIDFKYQDPFIYDNENYLITVTEYHRD